MVKAEDLVNQQKHRENLKYISFIKVYERIEKKINLASASNFYQVWYQIPQFILGQPKYHMKECKKYVIDRIKHDGFEVEDHEPNILLIKWNTK